MIRKVRVVNTDVGDVGISSGNPDAIPNGAALACCFRPVALKAELEFLNFAPPSLPQGLEFIKDVRRLVKVAGDEARASAFDSDSLD